jgi:hypothetical protein
VRTFWPIVSDNIQWLVKNGQEEKALHVLAKYHANGDSSDALVRLEYEEIVQALRSEEAVAETSYGDYLKNGNRQRLLILVFIAIGTNWVGNGIISYYLSPILNDIGVTSTLQQAELNLGLQIWSRKSELEMTTVILLIALTVA